MQTVRFGVLSTAKIGTQKVIPAMQAGKHCQIDAIASRTLANAQAAAQQLGIPKAYGSYDELLADREIDAIYNPLPNHMHVEWSIKALAAGKHVLCEKPIGMNVADAEQLLEAAKRYPQLKIMEAFMYRHHPQWQLARKLTAEGQIGQLRTIQSFFSYRNLDPADIRNNSEIGGGGLLDIGCYCISVSRFIFDRMPKRVLGIVEFDPAFKTDRLSSAILDFGPSASDSATDGTATFTCSTQLYSYQQVNIFGTEGRIGIDIPFNAPSDAPTKLWHQRGSEVQLHTLETCNQYTSQGDLFSRAILEDTPVPTPLTDAVENMRVIDAIFQSAKSQTWIAC